MILWVNSRETLEEKQLRLTSESELQGKFFKNFIKVQAGQSLSDRISELENRQSGLKYFESAIESATRKIGERFKLLMVNGRA